MAIKNKDGSIYKLNGPNPIIKSQNLWDDFMLHNMNFAEDAVKDNLNPKKTKISVGQEVKIKSEQEPNIPKIKKIELPTPKEVQPPKEINVPVFLTTSPPPTSEIKEEEDVIRPMMIADKLEKYDKIVLCCLPSKVKQTFDKLYGESQVKVEYGERFTFEAILIEEKDLVMTFWTHLENIQKFSIFYPKNKEKRWWQAEQIQKAPQGFFVNCLPSRSNPNF